MPAIFFVFLVILLQRANTNMIQSINPLFVKYVLDVNLVYIGVTTATYAVSTLLVRYILSIRVKPQLISRFIIAGLILFSFAIFGYFISTSFPEFLIFVILSGFATAIIMPFLLSLVHLLYDKADVEKNLTVYSLMLSLALVFGPLLGSALLSVLSIRYIYLMLCGFGITAFFFAVKINKTAKNILTERIKKEQMNAAAKNKETLGNDESGSGKIQKGGAIARLFKNYGFLEVIFYNTAFSIGFASIVAFGGVYAKDNFHIKYFEITLLFALFFISSLIVRLGLLYFTKKGAIKNKAEILNISIFLASLSFIFMVLSKGIFFYALSLILLGIPHALIFPIGTMKISEVVGTNDIVAANTIYQSNFDLGGIIGPFFLAYLGEAYGIRFVFTVIALFLFLSFIAGRLMQRNKAGR